MDGGLTDKVLCGCGAVFWTETAEAAGTFTLHDACPGCDRRDNRPEILSIGKLERKRAAAIIATVCDLLESEPVHALNGELERRIRDLARHFEDIGRPSAAARVRKGWTFVKGKFIEGAESALKPPSADVGRLVAVGVAPGVASKAKPMMMVPACGKCSSPVMDYPSVQGTAEALVCEKCRKTVRGAELIPFLEDEIGKRRRGAEHLAAGIAVLEEQIAGLKARNG